MGAQAVADEVVRRDVIDTRAQSIAHLFRQRVAASGSREALQYLVPDTGTESGERLERLTWDQTRERADLWAAGLVALGVGLEDRVAIASTTRVRVGPRRPRHHVRRRGDDDDLPDHARRTSPSSSPTPAAKVVFAENAEQVAEAARPPRRLPDCSRVVVFDGRRMTT